MNVKIFSAVISILFALLAYFFIFDDNLHPDIEPILTTFNGEHNLTQNGSVYQLGMWSALDDEPYNIGLWRIKQYQAALIKNNNKGEDITFVDYPENKLINEIYPQQNKPTIFCDIKDYACLNYLYESADLASQFMLEKQDFIERYDELMSFTDFSLYSAPSYSLPEPAFGPSADILQLKLLRIIELVKYNDFTYATNELIALINFHKRVLEQTPYMAPKIISMIELEMVLETSAYLMSKTTPENISLWQNVIDAIAPLNNNQLSMRQQFIHEFVAQVNALEKIDITQYDESLPATVNFLPIKILYKKNKTINMLYQWMTSQARLISLSSSNQIVKRNKLSMDDILKFDYQNPIGSMLAKDMAPKLLNLESFLYQIETKQQMIKHLYLAKNKTNASQQEYISPYTQKPAYISDHSFCVSTDESIQNDICLSAF